MSNLFLFTIVVVCLLSVAAAVRVAPSHQPLWGNNNAYGNTWNPGFSGFNGGVAGGLAGGFGGANNYASSWNPNFQGVNPGVGNYAASWNPNFSGNQRYWRHL